MASVPSTTWRMLDQRVADKPLAKGLDAVWDAGVGLAQRCVPRRRKFLPCAEAVLKFEKQFSEMSNAQLREAMEPLRETFRRYRDTREDLDRAFALIREVAMRQIGERPFGVQVAGAFALEAGCVVEMATGEGKTLTATMPATVAGWRGRGCHIITVNDYLAKRDAEWMGRIYHFCGLKVAHVEQGMRDGDRRAAYSADITYCTNKEVTADFLRDRLVLGRCGGLSAALLDRIAGTRRPAMDALVQRGLHYAIVDEADSILVDEAVTSWYRRFCTSCHQEFPAESLRTPSVISSPINEFVQNRLCPACWDKLAPRERSSIPMRADMPENLGRMRFVPSANTTTVTSIPIDHKRARRGT